MAPRIHLLHSLHKAASLGRRQGPFFRSLSRLRARQRRAMILSIGSGPTKFHEPSRPGASNRRRSAGRTVARRRGSHPVKRLARRHRRGLSRDAL